MNTREIVRSVRREVRRLKLSDAQLAKLLGASKDTARRLTRDGEAPRSAKLAEAVQEFLARSCMVDNRWQLVLA